MTAAENPFAISCKIWNVFLSLRQPTPLCNNNLVGLVKKSEYYHHMCIKNAEMPRKRTVKKTLKNPKSVI